MKTPKELCLEIKINKANLLHIAETGNINGTLMLSIIDKIEEYGDQRYREGLFDGSDITA